MTLSYRLFERFGVELEYMMVDAETLQVRPEADQLIREVAGNVDGDVSRGALEWSNELALHVIELKTGRPARRLTGLAEAFQRDVRFINGLLAKSGARLLPTAMHPWMNPRRESRLWPHDSGEIYAAFHRIFNCSGHGWTNLQATHLNLPFRSASEFRRLHSAIRLLLPILPALAASSPFVEGRLAPFLDMRLQTYRLNCQRIPSVTGAVVPDRIGSPAEYRRRILGRIYQDMAPHDPERILRYEWANARGAIARFERNTIEIRVIDIQECPQADLAIVQMIVSVLRALTDQTLSTLNLQETPVTCDLVRIMMRTARKGAQARIRNRTFLRALGMETAGALEVGRLWQLLLEATVPRRAAWRPTIEQILQDGCLSQRILRATGQHPTRRRLRSVYRRMADCLEGGTLFEA